MAGKLCVFSSANKLDPVYHRQAEACARRAAEQGYSLVFGGYAAGLMKSAADGFYHCGAPVTGVVVDFLESVQVHHPGCTEIIHAREFSDRKEKMIALADEFLVLPGGIGTMDEFFSVLSMKGSGRISGRITILNTAGFYDPLIKMLEEMEAKGFIRTPVRQLVRVISTAEEF